MHYPRCWAPRAIWWTAWVAPTPTVVAIVIVVATVELVVVATRIIVVWVVVAWTTTIVVPAIVTVSTVVVAIIAVRTVATVVAVVVSVITIVVAVWAVATAIISFRTIGFVEAVAYTVLKGIVIATLLWRGGAVARTTLRRAHILLAHALIGVVACVVALWSGVVATPNEGLRAQSAHRCSDVAEQSPFQLSGWWWHVRSLVVCDLAPRCCAPTSGFA